jgi:hypothetical protein
MRYLALVLLGVILTSCATVGGSKLSHTQEVRRQSQADDTLFRDLLSQIGGVGFIDEAFFPKASGRAVVKIETVAHSDGRSPTIEEWTIDHGADGVIIYTVKLTPDGRGGAYFQVGKKK